MEKYLFNERGDKLANGIHKKITAFQEYANRTGKTGIWKKNQRFYENDFYGEGASSDIIDTGAVGELKALAFNHFRNILRHMLNQLTAMTPAFNVSAVNSDVSSRKAADIGEQVLDYYLKVKRITKYTRRTAEKALVHGDGYIIPEWNPTIGRETAVNKNKIIREGDFDFTDSSVYDTFFDYTKKDKESWDWFSYRKRRNKFDLAKIFRSKKRLILGIKDEISTDPYVQDSKVIDRYGIDSPDIWVYTTYHKATNAVRKGKFVIHIGTEGECINLYEGPSIYGDQLPIFSLSPAEYLESSFGFTEANILRAPQMVINTIISSIFTNAAAAGANNIWTPTGANLNMRELVDGMNYLTSDSDKKPEVISFYKDSPGLKDLLHLSSSTMETLSGQNAAVRGNVQDTPNLKSGVAIATVINMAQQYSQSLEKSYVEMFEDLCTFMLKTLKKTAKTSRLIEITGKNKKNCVLKYKSSDLDGISRAVLDQTNPITKQPGGKIEIAMELLKMKQITPVEFFDVVNTGNLDVATESDEKMLDFIASAKETIMEGGTIPPIPGINHQLYIKEIHSLLFDEEILNNQENQQILQNIVKTIQQQLDLMRNGDEISNLIYGGKQPTPPAVDHEGELNAGALNNIPTAGQAGPPPAQPAEGLMPPQQ